jgi:hypothetical protein
MRLLQFFLNKEIVAPPYVTDPGQDPLNHPDLARMSLTELADLPLSPQNAEIQAARARQMHMMANIC